MPLEQSLGKITAVFQSQQKQLMNILGFFAAGAFFEWLFVDFIYLFSILLSLHIKGFYGYLYCMLCVPSLVVELKQVAFSVLLSRL